MKKDKLTPLFRSVAEGEIKYLAPGAYNLNSLRTRGGMLNRAVGYHKYTVSEDQLTKEVRIVCFKKGERP
jgi:hypothetical protein|nr:MAG TPA: hypothetical protein [Caudoviricetes sp.]